MNEYFRVGVITNTHGLNGEMKVFPTTEDIGRFEDLQAVLIDRAGTLEEHEAEHVKYFKNLVILKLSGIDSIEAAEKLKGLDLLVRREDAIPLGPGEYYIADVLGLQVSDEEGNTVGILNDVLQTGANDVYVISREGKKDLLLPVIPDCIKKVDTEAGIVTVHILDGLEDL